MLRWLPVSTDVPFLQVTTANPNTSHLPKLFVSLGVTPVGTSHPATAGVTSTLPVVLDGRVIGEIAKEQIRDLAIKLRTLKALGKEKVCECMHHIVGIFRGA